MTPSQGEISSEISLEDNSHMTETILDLPDKPNCQLNSTEFNWYLNATRSRRIAPLSHAQIPSPQNRVT